MIDQPLQLPNTHIVTLRHVLIGLLIFLITASMIAYVGYQSRFLISGPQITINEELPFTSSSSTLSFSGVASNISRIYLNGRQIFTDPDGNFSEFVVLNPGINILTISTENRYSQTRFVKHTIVQIE